MTEWSGKFTGWTDVDIIEEGIKEAYKYGRKLKEEGFTFDVCYTSYLKRAIRTLWVFMDALDMMHLPVVNSWKLNERHYGALQGESKPGMVEKYGEEQVNLWRRSYDVPPPKLQADDPRHPAHDPKYQGIDPVLLPASESLKDTYERSVPYFQETVESDLRQGKDVLLSGHHNSLRAIIKYLDNLSEDEVAKVNVPYCIPLVYELDGNARPLKHYYLAPDEEVKRVIDSIKKQTKK